MADEANTFTMSPADAGAQLEAMSAALHPPAPTATPTTPAQAAARLNQLAADPKWRENFLSSSAARRREFDELTRLQASGDAVSEVEVVDSVSGPNLPKRGYNLLIDGLREGGLSAGAEQYLRELDAGLHDYRPTEGEGLAAKNLLERLMRNSEFGKRYLNGDTAVADLVNELNRWIAFARDDGKPVSDWFEQYLAERVR